jgi:hypothetical protein
VVVNDGTRRIQAFIDYYCSGTVRVIDFAHAQFYVAAVIKAIFGAEAETSRSRHDSASKRLGKQPPQRLNDDLRLQQTQHDPSREILEIEQAIHYLEISTNPHRNE